MCPAQPADRWDSRHARLDTVDIVTPDAATVGGTSNPFAIETPDQTALFYANGNWLTFYDNGNTLVYKASSTGTTWPSGSGSVVPFGTIPGMSSGPGTNDTGEAGYTFAVTVNGNYVYYVVTSTDNSSSSASVKPGNYFFYNWGTVGSSGIITWANGWAQAQSLCSGPTSTPCSIYSGGQPAITLSTFNGNTYLYAAIPTVAKSGGSCTALDLICWNIQLWETQLTPTTPPAPSTWVLAPQEIPASVPANEPGASSVNIKLLPLTASGTLDGIALVDWIGNDVSVPSVRGLQPTQRKLHRLERERHSPSCGTRTCAPRRALPDRWVTAARARTTTCSMASSPTWWPTATRYTSQE